MGIVCPGFREISPRDEEPTPDRRGRRMPQVGDSTGLFRLVAIRVLDVVILLVIGYLLRRAGKKAVRFNLAYYACFSLLPSSWENLVVDNMTPCAAPGFPREKVGT